MKIGLESGSQVIGVIFNKHTSITCTVSALRDVREHVSGPESPLRAGLHVRTGALWAEVTLNNKHQH